jgi:hypothetical protein
MEWSSLTVLGHVGLRLGVVVDVTISPGLCQGRASVVIRKVCLLLHLGHGQHAADCADTATVSSSSNHEIVFHHTYSHPKSMPPKL